MSNSSGKAEAPSLPNWIVAIFEEFLEHQMDAARVLHLSMTGISMLRGRHGIVRALAKVKGEADGPAEVDEHLAKENELAQREVDNDFPLLHEQATVATWSALEAFIRSFVAKWLQSGPNAWQAESIKKLKVRLGDYESLQLSDRCLWVVDQLDQELSAPLRGGVNRFEALLKVFDLDGLVSEEQQKQLFELSQIRHVLLHRRGQADRKLLDACPWLKLAPGDRVKITHEMWQQYSDAVAGYVLDLVQRLRVRFGLPRYIAEDCGELGGARDE